MSTDGADALIEAYAQVSLANQRSFRALGVVLSEFNAHGIDVLVLKGADVLSRLYGVWGARPLTDVDLLVRDRDLPAIDRIVSALGYQALIDGNPAYRDPNGSLLLDMVTSLWYAEDSEHVWRRAVRRELADVSIRAMCADDLLVYLTAYSVLHRGHFVPSFAVDVGLLVRKERLNWDYIIEEARRRNLKIPLYHGLSYAARRESIPIHDHVWRRLAPARASERALQSLLRALVTEEPLSDLGHFLLLVSSPGAQRWRRLRKAIWPSATFLTWRYGPAGAASALRTRFIRAVHLLVKGVILSGAIGKRLVRCRATTAPPRLTDRKAAAERPRSS
jgi:Uncharacterised nucleotidyltransferase